MRETVPSGPLWLARVALVPFTSQHPSGRKPPVERGPDTEIGVRGVGSCAGQVQTDSQEADGETEVSPRDVLDCRTAQAVLLASKPVEGGQKAGGRIWFHSL